MAGPSTEAARARGRDYTRLLGSVQEGVYQKATFMCYMLPYLAYPILAFIGIKLPEDYYTGILGLINSMLFALTIILITQYLENQHFKLKL